MSYMGWYASVVNKQKKVIVQNRSERNRVDRKNMIQRCKNPIVEDDFHGFLHRTVMELNSYDNKEDSS